MATAFADAAPHRIIDVQDPEAPIIRRFGRHGHHIGPDEAESPWIPFGEGRAIRHLSFDVRNNANSNILWIKGPGVIGTHKHHGRIDMFCIEGTVRYLEYDWLATPGSVIYEAPGEAHTLVTDTGCKLLGYLQGTADYFDENGKYTNTLDVFWFIDHYAKHCEANGIPLNQKLFL